MSNDTLSMIEGAIEVAELTGRATSWCRARRWCSLPIDAPLPRDPRHRASNRATRAFRCTASDKDEILGILLAKDLLRCFAEGSTLATSARCCVRSR